MSSLISLVPYFKDDGIRASHAIFQNSARHHFAMSSALCRIGQSVDEINFIVFCLKLQRRRVYCGFHFYPSMALKAAMTPAAHNDANRAAPNNHGGRHSMPRLHAAPLSACQPWQPLNHVSRRARLRHGDSRPIYRLYTWPNNDLSIAFCLLFVILQWLT